MIVEEVFDQHANSTQRGTPLDLKVQAREHAHFLQYKNSRADYVNDIRNVVTRRDVATRFEQARSLISSAR